MLAAIGELGEVGGEDMRAYVEDLLPLIIDTLQDQSSVAKREVCLLATHSMSCVSGNMSTLSVVSEPHRYKRALVNSMDTYKACTCIVSPVSYRQATFHLNLAGLHGRWL